MSLVTPAVWGPTAAPLYGLTSETAGEDRKNKLDPNVQAVLPDLEEVLDVEYHDQSRWAIARRITAMHRDGTTGAFFLKVSVGHHGREALRGEFESTSAIHARRAGLLSETNSLGPCRTLFRSAGNLARPHRDSTSPSGKFGFHCVTYNGDMPQDTKTWFDTWEACFANGLRHVLRVREERAGTSDELNELLPALFGKVIPHLLRPLETQGRTIKPSLVHGDLWCGNVAVVRGRNKTIVFDPSSFYAHNEYELGNWLPERNQLRSYIGQYVDFAGVSAPEADFEDRVALYSLWVPAISHARYVYLSQVAHYQERNRRFNLHSATLFPDNDTYLRMSIDAIRSLVRKFPDGYVG